jgi:hypothetical protein
MLQWFRCITIAALLSLPTLAFAATEPLAVTVQASTEKGDSEKGIVIVSVTNRSSRPLLILIADSALITDGDHLLNDVMTITGSDGSPVAYQGRASRPAVSERMAYRTLKPGESKSSRVDLPLDYAIVGGNYTISYTQRYFEEAGFRPGETVAHEVKSDPLILYVNANLIQAKRAMRQPSARVSRAAPDSPEAGLWSGVKESGIPRG